MPEICQRCLLVDQVVTVMVPCTPATCPDDSAGDGHNHCPYACEHPQPWTLTDGELTELRDLVEASHD